MLGEFKIAYQWRAGLL